jgi:hypothetical protein
MADAENHIPWQEINWSGSISELVQIGRHVGKRRFVLRSGVVINCIQGGFGRAVDRCQWRITAPMPDLVAQTGKQLVEELRSRGVQCKERVLSNGRICYVDEDISPKGERL